MYYHFNTLLKRKFADRDNKTLSVTGSFETDKILTCRNPASFFQHAFEGFGCQRAVALNTSLKEN